VKARNEGVLNLYDAHLGIWEEPSSHGHGLPAGYDDDFSKKVLKPLLAFLRRRKWDVVRDPEGKIYQCIAKYMWLGTFGDLQVKIHQAGRTIKLDFFQDVNREHPTSGRHDLGRFNRMPYLIRLRFLVELRALIAYLQKKHGYAGPQLAGCDSAHLVTRLVRTCRYGKGTLITEDPLRSFNDRWDGEYEKRRGEHRFKRDANGWPDRSELGTYGSLHEPGSIKHWTNTKGYIFRGKVYPNMNGMFGFVYGPGARDCTYANSGSFFTPEPGQSLRKVKGHRGIVVVGRLIEECVKREDFEKAKILRDYRNKLSAAQRALAREAA
jgi:hypothetical protein